MLEGPPDAAEMTEAARAFGLVMQMPAPEPCEVWAEHWPAVRMFAALQTQWLHGLAGRTGLNYTALPVVARMLGVGPRAQRLAFGHLQVMEAEALRWFARQAA